MNHNIKLLAILAFAALLPSCKTDDTAVCPSGSGGNLTIAAFPKYAGRSVMAYAAWVKYNTREQPGNASENYDLIVPANAGEDHVHIKNLKCGDYYIYMNAYDSATGKPVQGGAGYTLIEYPTPTEVDVDIPVAQ